MNCANSGLRFPQLPAFQSLVNFALITIDLACFLSIPYQHGTISISVMDPNLLQQFRQQLATWIDRQMGTQRLPFQRLEICPELLTEQGRQVPDLVLWINRDSQLAGSMILLPDEVDSQLLDEAVAMAHALGLGHFTTWAARDVIIWQISEGGPAPLHIFPLPPANRVVPEDFQNTLNDLLEKLKIISVTTALSATEFTLHYYANLCLRNLQELAPGLTVSARLTAGQTAADEWLELAPLEKAWMSLWRILFLICRKHLPPGLQPERLEQVLHYALADFIDRDERLAWLEIRKDEPPLQDQEAVRLHHLASRMRQLGWPRCESQAIALVELLLFEVSCRYELEPPQLPWQTDNTTLWVNCTPPHAAGNCSLVVPRPCLAGYALKASLIESSPQRTYEKDLFSLLPVKKFTSAVAVFSNAQILDRGEKESRLILLRQAWPNRRFDLPNKTPVWVWEALYLTGQVSDNLTLVLPHAWYKAPGMTVLWSILTEHYQLTDITGYEFGRQALQLLRSTRTEAHVRVHLCNTAFEIPATAIYQEPGTIQIWMNAPQEILGLLRDRGMAAAGSQWADWTAALKWGTYLFLHTRFGRYLWDLCSDRADLPDPGKVHEAVLTHGMLLLDENSLTDLSLSASQLSGEIPETKILEREFISIFGPMPEIPQTPADIVTDQPKTRRTGKTHIELIVRTVFVDGVPHFPEHYLMNIYRPELIHYDLCGPLEVAEEFFDRISLHTPGAEHCIEVSGKPVAEALILVSHSDRNGVDLPKDEQLLEELLLKYRVDLKRLWHNLVRECRRAEPHQQAAIRLARRIWRQQGLPPGSI